VKEFNKRYFIHDLAVTSCRWAFCCESVWVKWCTNRVLIFKIRFLLSCLVAFASKYATAAALAANTTALLNALSMVSGVVFYRMLTL